MATIFDDFVFPEEDFQNVELMSKYNNVTGFKNVVAIEFEGRRFNVYDQYCKNPDCVCTEVCIDFVHFENKEIKEVHYLVYDYEKRKVLEMAETVPEDMITILKNSDDLHALFRIRNEDMRYAFAAHCAKRKLTKKNKMLYIPKIAARNEPCPCGSGRKYKNCCDK